MIKLIIFDYDGVIVDSFVNTYEAYRVITKKLNKKFPSSINEFRKVYGYSYIESYKNLGILPNEHAQAEEIYKKEMDKREPILHEGIKEVLETLYKRYHLVLLSANYQEAIVKQINLFGLSKYFDKIIGKIETNTPPLRKSENLIELMRIYKVTPDETIMIGDREIDYNHAQEAGIDHKIIVEYGWGYNKEKLKGWNQKVIVHKPVDLLKAIEALN